MAQNTSKIPRTNYYIATNFIENKIYEYIGIKNGKIV